MNEVLAQTLAYLFEAIVIAIFGVITYYTKTVLIPRIQDKQLYEIVQRYVRAAEKLAKAGKLSKGADKKDYVLRLLEASGIDLDNEILNAMIESAVEELDLKVTDNP